jgi:hypothetical protein
MGTTIYSDGTYRVEVWEDGAILVKPGDWLSKYSAAIHHNLTTLDVFYWPPDQAGGELKPIIDKNRLKVGDTVIHKPTWDLWKQRGPETAVRPGELIRPGEMDTEEFLRQLHDECGVSGEQLTRMSSVVTGAKWRDMSEATALGQLWYLLRGTRANWQLLNGARQVAPKVLGPVGSEIAGGALSFLAVFQWWAQAMLVWMDAQDTALRLQGLRAIAYSTTAFAFGDPTPVLPWGMECNLSRGTWRGVIPLDRYKRNWLDVASKTAMKLAADVAARGVSRQVYQTWIRWESNDRRGLARRLMEETARTAKMLPSERESFMSPVPIYPNDWPDNKSPLCY